jgi:phosphoglycerate dehydrogenase-like enzyme
LETFAIGTGIFILILVLNTSEVKTIRQILITASLVIFTPTIVMLIIYSFLAKFRRISLSDNEIILHKRWNSSKTKKISIDDIKYVITGYGKLGKTVKIKLKNGKKKKVWNTGFSKKSWKKWMEFLKSKNLLH